MKTKTMQSDDLFEGESIKIIMDKQTGDIIRYARPRQVSIFEEQPEAAPVKVIKGNENQLNLF